MRLVIIELNRCTTEIDMHNGAASRRCFRRGQLGERALGPFRRLLGIIKIEVDAIGSARGTQFFKPRVDGLTNSAEIGIGRVAECQDRETHAVEARRLIAHQLLIEINGSGWRIALAPRCGVDDKIFRLGENRHVRVRHIEDFGVETVLLSDFLRLVGERFGVAAFAGIKDRQRCPRFGRRSRRKHAAALGRLEAREETCQPGALLRSCPSNDLVQHVDVFRQERRIPRKQGCHGHRRLS